jgi:hypothetical protein
MKTSAAIVAILMLAGCAAQPAAPTTARPTDSTPSATASPEPLFVMITETGCAASPASIGEIESGRHAWNLRNLLAGPTSFQLMRIDGSYREAAGWFYGGTTAEPPFIAEELSRVLVAPGATGLLTDDLGPGVHAIVCFVLDEHEDIVTSYLAGPFIVADSA